MTGPTSPPNVRPARHEAVRPAEILDRRQVRDRGAGGRVERRLRERGDHRQREQRLRASGRTRSRRTSRRRPGRRRSSRGAGRSGRRASRRSAPRARRRRSTPAARRSPRRQSPCGRASSRRSRRRPPRRPRSRPRGRSRCVGLEAGGCVGVEREDMARKGSEDGGGGPLRTGSERRVPARASGELQARHGGRAHARAGSQRGCGDRIGRVLLHETVPSVPGPARRTNDTGRVRFMQPTSASRLQAVSGLPLDAPRSAALRRAADHIERAWASFDTRPRRPAGARRGARPRARGRAAGGVHAGADGPRRRGRRCSTRASRRRGRATSRSSARPASRSASSPTRWRRRYDVNLATHAGVADLVERQALRLGRPVRRLSRPRGGAVHQRRHDLEPDGARRGPRVRAARRPRVGPRTRRPAALYCSAEAHYSVQRAAEVLGLGAADVRSIADRRPAADDRLGGRGAPSTRDRRRRHHAGRRGGHRRHDADRRGRPDRRARGDLRRARRLAARRRRVRPAGRRGHRRRAAAVRRARAAPTPSRRRAQVAVPAEGLRRRAGARPRRAGARLRARRGVHAARRGRAERRRPHARVLAAVPGAQALARLPRARRRRPSARRSSDNLALARLLADEIRAHADLELVVPEPQLSIVPFRHVPPGVARPRRPQPRAGRGAPARRARLRRRRRRSTAAPACGRASSTSAPPRTTCRRSSTSRSSWAGRWLEARAESPARSARCAGVSAALAISYSPASRGFR